MPGCLCAPLLIFALFAQVLYDDHVWYGGVLEAGPELRDGASPPPSPPFNERVQCRLGVSKEYVWLLCVFFVCRLCRVFIFSGTEGIIEGKSFCESL